VERDLPNVLLPLSMQWGGGWGERFANNTIDGIPANIAIPIRRFQQIQTGEHAHPRRVPPRAQVVQPAAIEYLPREPITACPPRHSTRRSCHTARRCAHPRPLRHCSPHPAPCRAHPSLSSASHRHYPRREIRHQRCICSWRVNIVRRFVRIMYRFIPNSNNNRTPL
jgi:hypothetical protein